MQPSVVTVVARRSVGIVTSTDWVVGPVVTVMSVSPTSMWSSETAMRRHVAIVLSLKGKELGRRRAKLDRMCRYGTTFKVARKKIGTHRSLTVVVQFHGNRYLGANRSKFTAVVPSA